MRDLHAQGHTHIIEPELQSVGLPSQTLNHHILLPLAYVVKSSRRAPFWNLAETRVSVSNRALAGASTLRCAELIRNSVDKVKRSSLAMVRTFWKIRKMLFAPPHTPSPQAYQNLVRAAAVGELRQEMWTFLTEKQPEQTHHLDRRQPKEELPQPLSPPSRHLSTGASHWLNPSGSQKAERPMEAAREGQFLGHRAGRRRAPLRPGPTAQRCSRFPYFPYLAPVEIRHSQSQMKIHEIYCPLGVSGVTQPQTQLHGLLSPSQSSFPKGNNTWPKAPPATATSLNLQLPGADSKSQKRTDFSRER